MEEQGVSNIVNLNLQQGTHIERKLRGSTIVFFADEILSSAYKATPYAQRLFFHMIACVDSTTKVNSNTYIKFSVLEFAKLYGMRPYRARESIEKGYKYLCKMDIKLTYKKEDGNKVIEHMPTPLSGAVMDLNENVASGDHVIIDFNDKVKPFLGTVRKRYQKIFLSTISQFRNHRSVDIYLQLYKYYEMLAKKGGDVSSIMYTFYFDKFKEKYKIPKGANNRDMVDRYIGRALNDIERAGLIEYKLIGLLKSIPKDKEQKRKRKSVTAVKYEIIFKGEIIKQGKQPIPPRPKAYKQLSALEKSRISKAGMGYIEASDHYYNTVLKPWDEKYKKNNTANPKDDDSIKTSYKEPEETVDVPLSKEEAIAASNNLSEQIEKQERKSFIENIDPSNRSTLNLTIKE